MLCLLFCLFLLLNTSLADVDVITRDGPIRGLKKSSGRNHTYHAFLQIPYAQPPLGKLRFRDPQPVEPWQDILNATQEKSVCFQMSSNSILENEDCLYLNVYTPVVLNRKTCRHRRTKLPVMFYIHGGGFINGNSLFSTIGPQHFMDNQVIVVTVSYRLGPFGFLSTVDSVIPGNYGLKDQNMALKWVKRNIGCFGGNPDKVTIFGQSSGAVSVGYHIISRQSQGLFRGAIQQSGSVLTPHGYQRKAKDFAYTLAKFIDPNYNNSGDSWELLKFLQNVTADQIDDATEKFTQAPGSLILSDGSWFAPVIEYDHENAFVTERMYGSLEGGRFNQVPLMLGMTSEEIIGQAADLEQYKKDVAVFDDNLAFLVQADMHINDATNKTLAGGAIRAIYTNGTLQDNLGAAVRLFSDAYVGKPVIKHADLQSAYTDVFFYQFSYHGVLGNNNVTVEGAGRVGHSEDMRYLWVFSNSPDIESMNSEDLRTLDRYVKLYTNFAKTLNPTPKKDSLLGNVTWSKFTQDNSNYLDIDQELTIKTKPRHPAFGKWVDVYEKWAVKPYDTF